MSLRLSGKEQKSFSNEECLTDTDSEEEDDDIASNETKKLRNSLKKEFKETLIEVNERKVSNEYENTMKHFLIKSELFLEDSELKNIIENKMGVLCKSIIFNKNTIDFILR